MEFLFAIEDTHRQKSLPLKKTRHLQKKGEIASAKQTISKRLFLPEVEKDLCEIIKTACVGEKKRHIVCFAAKKHL